MGKERKILVGRVLLDIRICRAKQGDKHIDQNDGGEEVPRVVNDQSEWISESFIRRVKVR